MDHFVYKIRNPLFSDNVAVLSDIKWKIDVHIFIDNSSAIAFYGIAVIHQFFQIPPDCLFRHIIYLAQLTYHYTPFSLKLF